MISSLAATPNSFNTLVLSIKKRTMKPFWLTVPMVLEAEWSSQLSRRWLINLISKPSTLVIWTSSMTCVVLSLSTKKPNTQEIQRSSSRHNKISKKSDVWPLMETLIELFIIYQTSNWKKFLFWMVIKWSVYMLCSIKLSSTRLFKNSNSSRPKTSSTTAKTCLNGKLVWSRLLTPMALPLNIWRINSNSPKSMPPMESRIHIQLPTNLISVSTANPMVMEPSPLLKIRCTIWKSSMLWLDKKLLKVLISLNSTDLLVYCSCFHALRTKLTETLWPTSSVSKRLWLTWTWVVPTTWICTRIASAWTLKCLLKTNLPFKSCGLKIESWSQKVLRKLLTASLPNIQDQEPLLDLLELRIVSEYMWKPI